MTDLITSLREIPADVELKLQAASAIEELHVQVSALERENDALTASLKEVHAHLRTARSLADFALSREVGRQLKLDADEVRWATLVTLVEQAESLDSIGERPCPKIT